MAKACRPRYPKGIRYDAIGVGLKMRGALNPTGGLNYHFRHLLFRKRWLPFCDTVEKWLEDWYKDVGLQKYSTLVLIGPSAGYTLPEEFLGRFSQVVVNDIDPLAQMLFKARFMRLFQSIKLDSYDYFGVSDGVPQLRLLNEKYPQAVFLFCNILGQLPILVKKNKKINVEDYMKTIGVLIEKLSRVAPVASYHDRYSRNLLKPNEWVDHLTTGLFDKTSHQLVRKEFPWKLTLTQEHQIEFIYFISAT